jgi:hypothetical protein
MHRDVRYGSRGAHRTSRRWMMAGGGQVSRAQTQSRDWPPRGSVTQYSCTLQILITTRLIVTLALSSISISTCFSSRNTTLQIRASFITSSLRLPIPASIRIISWAHYTIATMVLCLYCVQLCLLAGLPVLRVRVRAHRAYDFVIVPPATSYERVRHPM